MTIYLTPFEQSVIRLVLAGYSGQQVASATGSKPEDARQTLKTALAKLQAQRPQAVNDDTP